MTFEETKEMFKKSIDTTDTMNQAIENLIQSIYLKGYNDALKHAHCFNYLMMNIMIIIILIDIVDFHITV
jgi:hypothetical protein